MSYLDVLSRKNRRRGVDSDSDSDDGPPPDPDEPAPAPVPKKEKKSTSGETREIQVSARKADDKGGLAQLSAVRREMLAAIRAEEDEEWAPLQFSDVTVSLWSKFSYDSYLTLFRRWIRRKHSKTYFPKILRNLLVNQTCQRF